MTPQDWQLLLENVGLRPRTAARTAEVSEQDDPRYEYVACPTCGETWQRIDFRGAPHTFLCADPQEPPLRR